MRPRWIILPLLFAIACSSSEEEEGSIYEDYPDRVKELIQDRRIDLGFDKEMVRRAWGRPNRTDSILDDERWMYTRLAFRTVERERDKALYEKERLIYEAKVAQGERVKEPRPTETLHQYRTQVWRSCTFRNGKVIKYDQPTDEFVDNWQTSDKS
jgi:hypothetical protein